MCRKLDSVKVTCYGVTKVWGDRQDAIKHFLEAMAYCEGSERERYTNIYLQLIDGCTECIDIGNDAWMEEYRNWNPLLI